MDSLAVPPTGERLRAAEAAFQAVIDLAPAERAAEIGRRCGGDASLRAFVERMVANEARGMGSFLETTLASSALAGLALAAAEAPARIGQYEVIRRIGEGGMGVVYEARQEHPHRTVALKVIRPGFATPSLLRRFQFEAEVLGQLQHPGIAHIYEAGVADGVAFFAMEYIRGPSLTQYVATSRLSRREILELFVHICDAVHHAHQKGVIHRDLKPGNILVSVETGEGNSRVGAGGDSGRAVASLSPRDVAATPKILDFGVARTVRADLQQMSLHTEIGQLVGTVPYMSPEQVAGDSRLIDVRSDVYSLGVILYELLAGRLPLDVRNCALPEAARIIREEEPSRLSSLNAALRGDLDTIVSKALEKDRVRRYQSAAELAADIRRCLRDEPIVARPASAMYHLVKFARRHRALVTGFAAAFLALMIGATVAIVFAVREREERWRADAKTVESERLAYRTSLTAASGAIQTGNVDVARRAIAEAPEHLRGWEWRHLAAVADQSLMTLRHHTDHINIALFSADGRRVATADRGGALCIWDGQTGALLRARRLADPGWAGWAVSPDGHMLVLAEDRRAVYAENALTGELLWRNEMSGVLRTESFRSDGGLIAVASTLDPVIRFLDPQTGRELRTMPVPLICSSGAIFSGDGSLLAGCRGPIVTVMDVESGAALHSFDSWHWQFGGSSDFFYINDAEGLRVVDARTFRLISLIDPGALIDVVRDRPDGLAIFFSSRSGYQVLRDRASNTTLAALHTHSRVACATYSSDGTRLLTGGLDGLVKIWDAYASPMPFVIHSGWQENVSAAAVVPDGQSVIAAGWGVVAAYDAADGALQWRSSVARRAISAVAIDPLGGRIAVGGDRGCMLLLDRDGELVAAAPPLSDSGRVSALAYFSDGQRLVAGSDDGTLRIIAAKPAPGATAPAERPPALRGHMTKSVPMLAVSQVGTLDRAAGPITGVATHPRRGLAAVAIKVPSSADRRSGGQIVLFDPEQPDLTPFAAFDLPVKAMAFSPDGGQIAIALESHTVELRHLDGSRPPQNLPDVDAAVSRLTFSPDGARVVGGCVDGTLHVWDPASGDHLATLLTRCDTILAAEFSADGRTLLAAATDAPLIAFETGPVHELAARREMSLRVRTVCEPLLSQRLSAESVAAEVSQNESLPRAVQEAAVAHVRARGTHLNWANSDAWGIARRANQSSEDYERALEHARAACGLCPGEPALLNTLGTCLFRVGDFAAAEAALVESDSLYVAIGRGEQPANWAVIAMCRWSRGEPEAARVALSKARELIRRDEFSDDAESQSFIDEAVRLISPPAPTAESP